MVRTALQNLRFVLALTLVVLLSAVPALAGLTIVGSNGIMASGADGINFWNTSGIMASGADTRSISNAVGITASGADAITTIGGSPSITANSPNGLVFSITPTTITITGLSGIAASGADGITNSGADNFVGTG